MELKELTRRLEKVEDPRRTSHGHILHKLVDILVIALCCLICNGTDFEDMEDFGKEREEWLKTFLNKNRRNYRYCFIVTHTNFFYTDNSQVSSGNMPLEESFALIDLLVRHKVDLVLQGHDHYREDLTYKNVRFTVLGTIKDDSDSPEYLKVHIEKDNISYIWSKP